MALKTWLLFLALETALSLSPGPAVFYVVSQGARDMRRALPATLGILTANTVYFVLSATSLGALVRSSARFFAAAKWVGAGYLIYLGVGALRAAAASQAVTLDGAADRGRARIYLGALALQLSNPKALLSFLALLPQFIDARLPVVPQMALLAATSILPEFGILLGYGWLAQRATRASAHLGMTRGLNRGLAILEGVGLLGCATLVLRVGPR